MKGEEDLPPSFCQGCSIAGYRKAKVHKNHVGLEGASLRVSHRASGIVLSTIGCLEKSSTWIDWLSLMPLTKEKKPDQAESGIRLLHYLVTRLELEESVFKSGGWLPAGD